jgi:hypothetical protein
VDEASLYLEQAERCRRLAAATYDQELQTRLLEVAANYAARAAALMPEEPKPEPPLE